MLYGLSPYIVDQITQVLLECREVEEAILFGSRAKGTFKEGSDIDIALIGKHIDLNVIRELEKKLYALWLPYTFDLIKYHEITDPELQAHIKRVGKKLYMKNNCID